MTSTVADNPQAQAKITVPHSQPMVALIGSGDEYLRLIEGAFPECDVLVRGNEITLTGTPADVGLIEVLVGEMLTMLRTGQPLNAESVERSISIMRSGARPSEVMTANILSLSLIHISEPTRPY